MSLEKAVVVYLWYDHCELRSNGDAKKVQDAIKSHDFEAFMEIKKKYQKKNGLTYFPETAFVFFNDEIVGEIEITKKDGFMLIDESDYECG